MKIAFALLTLIGSVSYVAVDSRPEEVDAKATPAIDGNLVAGLRGRRAAACSNCGQAAFELAVSVQAVPLDQEPKRKTKPTSTTAPKEPKKEEPKHEDHQPAAEQAE